MSKRVRLQDLSHAQIGALLVAFRGTPMKPARRGWYVPGERAWVTGTTFQAMVRLGLFSPRGGGSSAVLTAEGYRVADLAITLSREIALAVAGLPVRLPLEAKAEPSLLARLASIDDQDPMPAECGTEAKQPGCAENHQACLAGEAAEREHAEAGHAQESAQGTEGGDAHLLLDGGNLAFLEVDVAELHAIAAQTTNSVGRDQDDGDHSRHGGASQDQRLVSGHGFLPEPKPSAIGG